MQFESLSVMVVPPLLGLMLSLLFVLLVLVVDDDDVVTVAMPGATGGFAEDDDKDGRIFCTDGSRLSVNVTDVVVLVLLVLLLLVLGKRADFDDDDGDKTSSCVFEITILGSCVLMIVDDEGGLRCGILLLEQQSVTDKIA